jgi:hypothetical protein
MGEDRLTFSQRVEWIVVAGRELRALVKRANGVNGEREWQRKQPLRPGIEGQQGQVSEWTIQLFEKLHNCIFSLTMRLDVVQLVWQSASSPSCAASDGVVDTADSSMMPPA